MARPLTPQEIADATGDHAAVVPKAHVKAEDGAPRWLQALRWVDDVLFGVSETPWLDAACIASLVIVIVLCLLAWLLQ